MTTKKINPFNGQPMDNKEKKNTDPNSEYFHPNDEHFELLKLGQMNKDFEEGHDLREVNHMDQNGGYTYKSRDFFNFHRSNNISFKKKVL